MKFTGSHQLKGYYYASFTSPPSRNYPNFKDQGSTWMLIRHIMNLALNFDSIWLTPMDPPFSGECSTKCCAPCAFQKSPMPISAKTQLKMSSERLKLGRRADSEGSEAHEHTLLRSLLYDKEITPRRSQASHSIVTTIEMA